MWLLNWNLFVWEYSFKKNCASSDFCAMLWSTVFLLYFLWCLKGVKTSVINMKYKAAGSGRISSSAPLPLLLIKLNISPQKYGELQLLKWVIYLDLPEMSVLFRVQSRIIMMLFRSHLWMLKSLIYLLVW